ncbi:uncharacterized protein LOC117176294 [Belonocnema kinseyi]|uniref:uncharacterized protein LOC117176294 n=1 Tax=Belonocnema kinseyi TaxID=2817044 RepID=UPI00143CEC99|nr:uncharacterized protein LOC117176294 [Belonocnema kinseyi]XP_033222381.1 uncharacterized protein LOC117176294 [Belonocnema kinseyi]XP_033222382.1 uncharacterized protein LOC117176294 [Belonocnema kinseyi]
MSSTESASPTKSDACIADLQNVKRTKPTAIELFPWLFKFDASSEHWSMPSLLQNMKCIKSNISLSITECYDKPLKAAKLKESIQQALIWILIYYRKLPKVQKSIFYHESMSDILAMYIDMELRASKRPTEQLSEITTRIICCLYVYLEKSIEHMLDTLIKVRNMSSQFHFILDPVMKKLLEGNPKEKRARPKTQIMYVRYLLAFRLWRDINKAKAVKKEIVKTAVSFLGSPPSVLPEFLTKHIPPNGSGSQTLSTNLFMKEKLLDVKACCADFIHFCKAGTENSQVLPGKMNCLERLQGPHQQQKLGDNVAEDSSSLIKNSSLISHTVVDHEPNNSLIKSNAPDKYNLPENLKRISINDSATLSSNQSVKTPRPLVRRSVKKSNDIIIIDITDEESTPKVIKKKVHKKFPWLEQIKRHLRLNPERKEGSEILGLNVVSPAKQILESLILVTDDSEQKKIETDLYSSFDSWIGVDNLQPTTDIRVFFGDDLNERSSSSLGFNSDFSTTKLPFISSSTTCTSDSVLQISSDRLNSYDSDSALEITSDELSKDIAETESVIKHVSRTCEVSRFESSKTDCQSEADSMISDSNENMSEIQEARIVCAAISTMVLEEGPSDMKSSNISINCRESEDIVNEYSKYSDSCAVSSIEERIKESRDDYSKAIDYTLRKDNTCLPSDFTNADCCYNPENETNSYTIPEPQFQENIENLSLLASVSQQVAAQKVTSPSKNSSPDHYNRIVSLYPEDFEKVALQVEVISTSDGLMENNFQSRETRNAILNGETVVLMQKSPNSNVYVINKAAENKNSVCESFEHVDKAELPQESESLARSVMVKTESGEKKVRVVIDDKKSTSNEVSKSSIDKRKSGNLPRRQNVKQEYSVSGHCACGILGCSVMDSLSHDLANPQIPLHIPVAHPTPSHTLPPLYGNFPANSELCVPYNKHCSTVSCGLPVNPPSTLLSHTNTNSCGRSHGSCLSCTYEMVAHYQCVHPTSDPHSSFIEGNSYFIPQTSAVQEHERTKGESVMDNLYEDKLLCKVEKSLLESKPLEKIDVKFNQDLKYQVEINNKLPLKKRLKAFNQTSYDVSIKMEKSGSYPGTPMMSIANLEVQNESGFLNLPEIGATVELTTEKEDSPIKNRHHINIHARRDYRKDGMLVHNGLEKMRETKDQRRLVDSQLSNVPLYHDTLYQRQMKSSLPRKEVGVSALKRLAVAPSLEEQSPKKAKKSSTRQTRSSQRNVPKVNYKYTEVDPEWNPSGDMKRKRKKSSR